MTGNPKTSKWRSTPQSERGRPGIQLTLSPQELDALTELSRGVRSRSQTVGRLIMSAWRGHLEAVRYDKTLENDTVLIITARDGSRRRVIACKGESDLDVGKKVVAAIEGTKSFPLYP
jgi:hypothetical protein